MSKKTKLNLQALPCVRRRKVENIVLTYAEACYAHGLLPTELDRVYVEAIEAIQLESAFHAAQMPAVNNWERGITSNISPHNLNITASRSEPGSSYLIKRRKLKCKSILGSQKMIEKKLLVV